MTLFIACILLYQYEWPWYWYPIAMAIWGLHEFHLLANFLRARKVIMPPPRH